MPLISQEEATALEDWMPSRPNIVPLAGGTPEPEQAAPGIGDTLAATWRQNNFVSSTYNRWVTEGFTSPKPVAGYNPFSENLSGFEDHLDRFVKSGSPEETQRIKNRVTSETADRQTASRAGAGGIASSIAAGIFDPLTIASMALPLAPFAGATRTARVLSGVALNAAADTASEVLLHQNQELRTVNESLFNVGAGAILTGAFGTLATRVPKNEFEAMRKALDSELAGLTPRNPGGSGSFGAAATSDLTTLADETIAKGGRTLAKTIGRISPITRVMQAPVVEARQLGQRLTDVPYMLEKNLKGGETTDSAETNVKRKINMTMYGIVNEYEDGFKEYSKRAGKDAVSAGEFGSATVKALRNGDKSDIPEVQALAKYVRKVFDEDKKALKELGVLPEDFELLGAESYFPRIYNHNAIGKNPLGFKAALKKHYTENPRLPIKEDEVVSALEGAPSPASRFFKDRETELAGTESHVLRDRRKTEVGRLVTRYVPGHALQIVDAQVASAWKNKKLGVRLFEDAVNDAETKGVSIQSGPEVGVDQLRVYAALERRGYRVTYSDPEAVQGFLKKALDGDTYKGKGPAVLKVEPPAKVLKDLEETKKLQKEILKTSKTSYIDSKNAEKEARLKLRRAEARVRKLEERQAERDFADEQSGIKRRKNSRREQRRQAMFNTADAAVEKYRVKAMEADVAAKDFRKARAAAGANLRKTMRGISKTKGAVNAAKRAKDAAKLTADKAATPEFRDPVEVEAAVNDTYHRIMGTVRGVADLGEHSGSPRPMKERTLDVPDSVLEPWLVNDFDRVMSGYVRAMAPQIEMRRMFPGDHTLTQQIQGIMDAADAKAARMTSNKEIEKLRQQTAAAIKDITAIRDRITGQVGPRGDSSYSIIRLQRLARAYNYARSLGGQTLSSFSDYGHVVSRYGLARTGAATAKFLSNVSYNKISRQEAQKLGTALEWVLDTRGSTVADIGDEPIGSTAERVAHNVAQKFTRLSGMATWNSSLKSISTALEQDMIMRAFKRGNLSAFEKGKLAQNGIGESQLKRIGEQMSKYGDDSEGLWRARTEMWDDQEAAKALEDAVVRAADLMVMTRGAGDLPLFMDGETAKTLMQFKSFGMAAVNRIMIPMAQGIAHGDLASANGFAMMLGLGALTYYVKEVAAGREPELSPDTLIAESLNWSGVLGFLPDVYAPVTYFNKDIPKLSKYSDLTPWNTALGPTFGTVVDVTKALKGITEDGEVSQKDLHAGRKLMIGQNIFYLRRIINAVEGEIGEAIDAEGSTQEDFLDRVNKTEVPES